MAFQRWQIGLDIQNGKLCTVAIQRRRQGWQLRHWQQQTLPDDALKNGVLQSSPAYWRRYGSGDASCQAVIHCALACRRNWCCNAR